MIHKELVEKLEGAKSNGVIKDYRLSTVKLFDKSFGTTGKGLGGVYDPISISEKFSGNLLVEWMDGNISKSVVNPSWNDNFKRMLKFIKTLAYKDDADKNFLSAVDSKIVEDFTKQYDERISSGVFDSQIVLVDKVKELQAWMTELGEENQYSGLGILKKTYSVTTSRGLDISENRTSVGYGVYLGEYIGYVIASRSLGYKYENELKVRVAAMYKVLKNSVVEGISKESTDKSWNVLSDDLSKKVLFMPKVFTSLFEYFFVHNILGSQIYSNGSAYRLEDFGSKVVASKGFDVTLYPRREMSLEAQNFTGEGWINPEEFTFVKSGKLLTPVTSMRYANLLKLKTTPLYSSAKLIDFGSIESDSTIEEVMHSAGDCVLITSLLGLHTQDSSTGDFSLVCPHSIIIKDGEMVAGVEVMLKGNWFDLMRKIDVVYRDRLTNLPFVVGSGLEMIKT